MALMEAEREANVAPLCRAKTKSGSPCKGRATSDGYCMVHTPSRDFDAAELGRKGGRKSALARRSRKESRQAELRSVRDLLREAVKGDEEWQKALISAYRDPVVRGEDMKLRRETADATISQLEGKPQQNIQARHEYQITVVSRTQEALAKPFDLELPAEDVGELEAGS